MNESTKHFHGDVFEAIKETQDNTTLSRKDIYGTFLLDAIMNNTDKPDDLDNAKVDTEELADNLRYAINQFTKALVAVSSLNS